MVARRWSSDEHRNTPPEADLRTARCRKATGGCLYRPSPDPLQATGDSFPVSSVKATEVYSVCAILGTRFEIA